PTTAPLATTSKSSSFHSPDGRLAEARLRISWLIVSVAAHRLRRECRLHRAQKRPSQKRLDPPPKQRLRRTAIGGRAEQGRVSWHPFLPRFERGSDQAAPPSASRWP